MHACCVRRSLTIVSWPAAILGAAESRADFISSSPDPIQPGFHYNSQNDSPPVLYGGTIDPVSGTCRGCSTNLRLFNDGLVPLPGTSAVTPATSIGRGVMSFTDQGGLSHLLNFQYQLALSLRRREPTTSRPTMDIAIEGMDFAGLPSWIRLRESPTLSSTGVAIIEQLAGRGTNPTQFRISSFFDIFTEISLDNGQSWIPASGPVHLDLVPAPSAAALMSLGLLSTACRRRR